MTGFVNLRPGLVIGSYQIDREIGRGGRTLVYRAWQRTVGRWVVLKVLRKRDPGALEDFRREVQRTANLAHGGVRQVYDAGQTSDGYPFLSMEFVDTSLRQILRARREQGRTFGRSEVARLLEPVADALDHIHSKGVVHLDIKPENILVFRDGRVVLADFGSVRRAGSTTHEGTPMYFSPEQAAGDRPVSPQSDIYSLGIVAYEMLTGQLPFGGDMVAVLVRQHLEEPPPSLRQANPHLPRDLEWVLDDALSKEPRQRSASARAFIEQIRTGGRRPPAGERRRFPRPKLAGFGLWLLLILAGIVAIFLLLGILLVALSIFKSMPTPAPTATTSPSPSGAATAAVTSLPLIISTARLILSDMPWLVSMPTPTRPAPTRVSVSRPSTDSAQATGIGSGREVVAVPTRFTCLNQQAAPCRPV